MVETEEEDAPREPEVEISVSQEEQSQTQENLSDCKHYFGFMSEKEHKQQMPEECMLCSKIIDCMIKEKGSASGKT